MASSHRDIISGLAETVFYILPEDIISNTCRSEFYYECDWNGARIIVIVQQTKKCLENNNIMMKILPVLLLAGSLP